MQLGVLAPPAEHSVNERMSEFGCSRQGLDLRLVIAVYRSTAFLLFACSCLRSRSCRRSSLQNHDNHNDNQLQLCPHEHLTCGRALLALRDAKRPGSA